MSDENNDENAYNRTMNIAGHFITLFLNVHLKKIITMSEDAKKYLSIDAFQKLNNCIDELEDKIDEFEFQDDSSEDDDDYICEKETEIFNKMMMDVHSTLLKFLGAFTGKTNFFNCNNVTDIDKFNILIIHLRRIDKIERNDKNKLIIDTIESLDCSEISYKKYRSQLVTPYVNVFRMIKTIRNYEAHKVDQTMVLKLSNSAKKMKSGEYILDPITNGQSFGNRFSMIGIIIMLTYQIIEILDVWNDTFKNKNFKKYIE